MDGWMRTKSPFRITGVRITEEAFSMLIKQLLLKGSLRKGSCCVGAVVAEAAVLAAGL